MQAYSLWDKPFDMREMIDGVCSGHLGQYTGGSGQLAGTSGGFSFSFLFCSLIQMDDKEHGIFDSNGIAVVDVSGTFQDKAVVV